jgi:hypothetical protein
MNLQEDLFQLASGGSPGDKVAARMLFVRIE